MFNFILPFTNFIPAKVIMSAFLYFSNQRRTALKVHCNSFRVSSAKFGTCTVAGVNGTLVKDKMRKFKDECAHFSFNKCLIYTHDGASAKFSTNSHETDNSVYRKRPRFFAVVFLGSSCRPQRVLIDL